MAEELGQAESGPKRPTAGEAEPFHLYQPEPVASFSKPPQSDLIREESGNDSISPDKSGIGDVIVTLPEPVRTFVDPLALAHHRANTARFLAYTFAFLLGIAFLADYAATFTFVCLGKSDASAMKEVFTAWIPVLTGIASAAATFYFTKER